MQGGLHAANTILRRLKGQPAIPSTTGISAAWPLSGAFGPL